MTIRSGIATIPFYPTLIAVAFVLNIWQEPTLDLPPLIRPLVFAIVVAGLLTLAALALTRDRDIGGAVAGILVLGLVGGDDARVLALSVAAIILLLLVVRRARSFNRELPWPRITAGLNVFAVLLVVLVSVRAIQGLASAAPAAMEPLPVSATAARPLPDVVVILLDAHGRQDVLADTYHEDIGDFVAALEDRGFHVSPKSRSNYMITQLTLGSMFNLDHIPELGLPAETDPAYLPALRSRTEQNRGFDLLRSLGYRIVAVGPGYEGVSLRGADRYLDGGQIGELERGLLANSALEPMLGTVAPSALADQLRARTLWNLDPDNWLPGRAATADVAEPYFAWVHVPSPHPPYVFERDGNPVPVGSSGIKFAPEQSGISPDHRAEAATAYAAQLAYIDSVTISTIDEVIASVPKDAVIIVMSDHGPDVHVKWNDLNAVDAHERFANFFAARTPGHDRLFGDAPTPVNTLAVLLNAYAGTNLPMRSDSSFLGYPPYAPLVDIGDADVGQP